MAQVEPKRDGEDAECGERNDLLIEEIEDLGETDVVHGNYLLSVRPV
jgi:hypothetical protein